MNLKNCRRAGQGTLENVEDNLQYILNSRNFKGLNVSVLSLGNVGSLLATRPSGRKLKIIVLSKDGSIVNTKPNLKKISIFKLFSFLWATTLDNNKGKNQYT